MKTAAGQPTPRPVFDNGLLQGEAMPQDQSTPAPTERQQSNAGLAHLKVKPKAQKQQTVRFACGHTQALDVVLSKQCGKCRHEAVSAMIEATKENAKRKAGSGKQFRRLRSASRLPDGSEFRVSYDAATRTWSGVLVVGGDHFATQAGGVFWLLSKLDTIYRRHLRDSQGGVR